MIAVNILHYTFVRIIKSEYSVLATNTLMELLFENECYISLQH